MSGLDVDKCRIIEVAAIVTDIELNELESYHNVVFQEPEVLDAMDRWCTDHHGKSGLTAAVPNGIPEAQADADVRALIERHWAKKHRAILCGNSIGTDKAFLERWWPKVSERLHYRVVDVSSWKVVMQERFGMTVPKAGGHRALDDIRESIAELAAYVNCLDLEKLKSTS